MGKTTINNTKFNISSIWKALIPFIIAVLSGIGASIALIGGDGEIKVQIEYAPESRPVVLEEEKPGIVEDILTVESIDGGGQFKDKDTGVSELDTDVYYELGAMESVDTTSPEAFSDSVLDKCIIANNYYGAQCVSLARAFWFDYAGFDVSTCGTGLAKGMMNCADQNAGDKFKVIWSTDEIIDGTWIVLDGSQTGHICMAMGEAKDGYVACLGENQGGKSCGDGIGGSAANIINISLKNFIGGYTPIDYIPVTPVVPDTGIVK